MATFTQRPGGWFAQVRRKGHKSISRTFNTKAEAERWALQIEASMGVGQYVDTRETLNTTLADCLRRYASEIVPGKKGADRDQYRVNLWLADAMAGKAIGAIRQMDVAAWRDARISAGVSGSTVGKDLALLSHVFTIAIKEWGMPLQNPVASIRKPKPNRARDRRLQAGDESAILEQCGLELRAFVIIALETSMRRGEIACLMRADIRGNVAYLPDTKNGAARQVPLSTRALAAINSLPLQLSGRLFSLQPDAYSKGFLRACRAAGIDGLNLHDLRHEATSRFFERGLDMMQVASITGHKGFAMLKRYTHLRAEELAKLLG